MLTKRGQVWENLLPWLIGVIVLVIMLIAYLFLSGKMNSAIEYFKTLWRFGR